MPNFRGFHDIGRFISVRCPGWLGIAPSHTMKTNEPKHDDGGAHLSLRVEPELRAALEAAAAAEHRTLSGQVRHLVVVGLGKQPQGQGATA